VAFLQQTNPAFAIFATIQCMSRPVLISLLPVSHVAKRINRGMLKTQRRPAPGTVLRPGGWSAWLPIKLPFRGRLPKPGGTQHPPSTLRHTAGDIPRVQSRVPGGYDKRLRLALTLLPTILATLYFTFIASDRYVSEAKFVVRTAAKPNGFSGFGSFLQVTGLVRSQDDVFSVQDFVTSRDAVRQLAEQLPITDIYNRPEADFIARYPSLFYGATLEQFHKYFQWMVTVTFSSTTGITTLRVQAFRPDDAKAIAMGLLDLGEQTVNRMNERIQNDAVRVAAEEVNRDEQRLVAVQLAITNFRNRELMIDPARSSVIVTEVTARLDADLTQTKAQLTEMTAASPSSPQIGVLQRHIAALETQILAERTRISDPSTGLANKLADYERLTLEREFAKQALTAASASLDTARAEARRQQLYLERVVEPNEPDYAMMPERPRAVLTIFGLNVLALLVVWLIFAGVQEHAAVGD
jgi:capsular polysaccharide transport system permease protein